MQSSKVKKVLSDSVLLILLIALIILFSIMSDKFFTQINLTNILVQNVHVAVCATAVLLLMISGSVDLSVGYQVSCTAVLCAMMIAKFKINPVVSILAAGAGNRAEPFERTFGQDTQSALHDHHTGHHGSFPGHFLSDVPVENLL